MLSVKWLLKCVIETGAVLLIKEAEAKRSKIFAKRKKKKKCLKLKVGKLQKTNKQKTIKLENKIVKIAFAQ